MSTLKFPPTVEIKRAVAAVLRAGVEIGSIEIHPRKIIIYPKLETGEKLGAYDLWKLSDGKQTERVRHAHSKSDAKPTKSKA